MLFRSYYSKTKEKTFEFGYEESYGYLISSFVRDKDSLQALVMISEMTNYYRLKGLRLDQVMEELYKKYGYHSDKLYSIFFKGQAGANTMNEIMNDLHSNPLNEIAGWRKPERFTVKAADGITDLYGVMWKPADFDSTKCYPIISCVYPGPYFEFVPTAFILDNSYCTRIAQLGFIVITVDRKSTRLNSSHSRKSRMPSSA